MRKNHIDELLEEIGEQISSLKKYKKITKVKFKNVLENLRSSLDYIAQDINEELLNNKNKVYFPYSQEQQNFKKSITRNLPDLETKSSKIYTEIENLQPYKSNDDWLVLMCKLTNEAKHNGLINFEKTGSDVVDIFSGNHLIFRIIDAKNSVIKGPRIMERQEDGSLIDQGMMGTIHIDESNVEIEGNNPLVNFSITDEKKLLIEGYSTIELIPFVEKCFSKIKEFSNNIYIDLERE